MKMKNFLIPVVVTCLLMLLIIFLIRYYPLLTSEIKVPQHYPTIQSAIDAAKPGDTILVARGVYNETLVIEKNNLTIVGENQNTTIIDSNQSLGPVVWIRADGVRISGFTIRNSCRECYGIYVHNSSNTVIEGNIVSKNGRGIYLINCNNIIVKDNTVVNNAGSGIEIRYSKNVILKGNEISGNKYNFGVWGLSLPQFIHNIDTSNRIDGKPIHYWINRTNEVTPLNIGYMGLINCLNITVENITLSNNGHGLLLAYTNNSTIRNVTAIKNWEGISLHFSFLNSLYNNNVSFNLEGLHVYRSSYNNISLNIISYNDEDGILLDYAESNNIYANTIERNINGAWITNSFYNKFFHNNFLFNARQTGEYWNSGDTWDDGYPSGGNYWSDYDGVDEKSGPNQDENGPDGIGDTPYYITEDGRYKDRFPLMDPYIP